MKTFLSLVLLLNILSAAAQPKVYFGFVTHNEETSQWNGSPYYNLNRMRIISLANYFDSVGAKWNLQSDWVFLTNVITKDSALWSNTGNKNVLRYLHEDLGVEMDPHGHESTYIYPDLAKLLDSLGLPESKIIGGTIYNDSNGVNIWTNLVNGQYGIIFPGHFWKPDYMMGGGTPNHVADIKYFGMWKPQDPANYLVHDPASPLTHMGVGCEMKIRDTTTVSWFVEQLRNTVNLVQSGAYPDTGFYFQSIFFEQGDLNNLAFYNKVIEITDSVNQIIAEGHAEWKTMKEAYTIWETAYAAEMFQWECGNELSAVASIEEPVEFIIYPNPASVGITIHVTGEEQGSIMLYDSKGALVKNISALPGFTNLDVSELASGIYLVLWKCPNNLVTEKLVIK